MKELLTHPELEKEAPSTILRTPLHLACIRGHLEIVRMMVSSGVNKNCRDFDENTPLHFASEYGNS